MSAKRSRPATKMPLKWQQGGALNGSTKNVQRLEGETCTKIGGENVPVEPARAPIEVVIDNGEQAPKPCRKPSRLNHERATSHSPALPETGLKLYNC